MIPGYDKGFQKWIRVPIASQKDGEEIRYTSAPILFYAQDPDGYYRVVVETGGKFKEYSLFDCRPL